jgi:hypothetical protein
MKGGSLAGLVLGCSLFVGCNSLPLGVSSSASARVSAVHVVQEGGKTGLLYEWSDPAGFGVDGSYAIVDWDNDKLPNEVWKGTGKGRRVFGVGTSEFDRIAPYFEQIRERAPRDCGYFPENAPDRWYERVVARQQLIR